MCYGCTKSYFFFFHFIKNYIQVLTKRVYDNTNDSNVALTKQQIKKKISRTTQYNTEYTDGLYKVEKLTVTVVVCWLSTRAN